MAAGIVSAVHMDTKCNPVDMGTEVLPGPTHQFLLENQKFPPVSSAGECKTDTQSQTDSQSESPVLPGEARLVLSVLTSLDRDVAGALQESAFVAWLACRRHTTALSTGQDLARSEEA